jgi:YesN/AraC family two-component response regulator
VGTKSQSVLLVEDAPRVLRALEAIIAEIDGLVMAGCAMDVPQGLEAIRKMKPDIVILDIQLPGGSGLDLLKALRSHEPRTQVAIVFSGVGATYRRTCLEMGSDFFFDKPLELALLEDLLRKLAITRQS